MKRNLVHDRQQWLHEEHHHQQRHPIESQDMKRLEKDKQLDHVRLMMKFKDDYPFTPPFVRIVYPRFKRSTGYIIDGAFCMELLTNQVCRCSWDGGVVVGAAVVAKY